MKRYIRTKDEKIKDLKVLRYAFEKLYFPNQKDYEDLLQSPIIKTSDTIEELVEVGDLTTYGFVRKLGKGDKIFYNGFEWIYLDLIIELYTKKGDNYILVATKENGEWRVL